MGRNDEETVMVKCLEMGGEFCSDRTSHKCWTILVGQSGRYDWLRGETGASCTLHRFMGRFNLARLLKFCRLGLDATPDLGKRYERGPASLHYALAASISYTSLMVLQDFSSFMKKAPDSKTEKGLGDNMAIAARGKGESACSLRQGTSRMILNFINIAGLLYEHTCTARTPVLSAAAE